MNLKTITLILTLSLGMSQINGASKLEQLSSAPAKTKKLAPSTLALSGDVLATFVFLSLGTWAVGKGTTQITQLSDKLFPVFKKDACSEETSDIVKTVRGKIVFDALAPVIFWMFRKTANEVAEEVEEIVNEVPVVTSAAA